MSLQRVGLALGLSCLVTLACNAGESNNQVSADGGPEADASVGATDAAVQNDANVNACGGEALRSVGALSTVSDSGNNGHRMSLVATDTGVAAAWVAGSFSTSAQRYIERATINANGTVDLLPNTLGVGPSDPSLVWNGTELGVFWHSASTIYLARQQADGTAIGAPIPITEGSPYGAPGVVWNQGAYTLAYPAANGLQIGLQITRLSATGTVEASSNLGGDLSPYNPPSLAWTGTGYGLSYWEEAPGLARMRFRRLDANRAPIGDVVTLSDVPGNYVQSTQVVWTGSNFVVAWIEFDVPVGEWYVHTAVVESDGTVTANQSLLSAGEATHLTLLVDSGSVWLAVNDRVVRLNASATVEASTILKTGTFELLDTTAVIVNNKLSALVASLNSDSAASSSIQTISGTTCQ